MVVDSTESLFSWIKADDQVRSILAAHHRLKPEQIDIQGAAMATLNLHDPVDLLDRIWDAGELLALVRDVDFGAWNDFEDVVLQTSILPPDVPRRVDEETVKIFGEKWRIHRYDPDPFPSLPHAHNLYNGYKLDLTDGKLYRRHQFVRQLPKKQLEALRARISMPLPPLAV